MDGKDGRRDGRKGKAFRVVDKKDALRKTENSVGQRKEKEAGKSNRQQFGTLQLTKIALMVAMLSVLSYVRIPLPASDVGISALTIGVNLIALLLAPKEAFVTILCYLLLGLVGAPVLGGSGGPGKLFGPSGGYLLAFLLAVVFVSALRGKKYHLGRYLMVTVFAALVIVDGLGFLWFQFVMEMELSAAFIAGYVAFAPLDVVKCVIACVVARPLQKAMRAL